MNELQNFRNKIKSEIIDYLHNKIENNQDSEYLSVFANDHKILDDLLFSPHSKKLTVLGGNVMKKYFLHYPFVFPKDFKLTLGHLRYLEKNTNMPYFCNLHSLVVFDEFLGSMLVLVDGDLDRIIETFAT